MNKLVLPFMPSRMIFVFPGVTVVMTSVLVILDECFVGFLYIDFVVLGFEGHFWGILLYNSIVEVVHSERKTFVRKLCPDLPFSFVRLIWKVEKPSTDKRD